MRLVAKRWTDLAEELTYKRHSGHYRGWVGLRVISNVQHEEAIGVNSMTELFSLPEELISWEFDGQAIIATGTLLTSLGQVAGCSAEYKHSDVTS